MAGKEDRWERSRSRMTIKNSCKRVMKTSDLC